MTVVGVLLMPRRPSRYQRFGCRPRAPVWRSGKSISWSWPLSPRAPEQRRGQGRAAIGPSAIRRTSARTVSARRRTGACRPESRTDAAPAAWFVAQTERDRAVTIPWIKARATGALAGLLARGSSLDARPSRALGLSGCSLEGNQCIALTAYSCRDSRGVGRSPVRTAFPFKPLAGHRRDHEERSRLCPSPAPIGPRRGGGKI